MFTRGKGVCLLFLCDLDDSVRIFAPTKPAKKQKAENNRSAVLYDQMNADFTEAGQTIVARIVRMPKHDRFGLSHVISNATRLGSPESEVFAAHAFWKELISDKADWMRKDRAPATTDLWDQSPGLGLVEALEQVSIEETSHRRSV
jgi:hypothetical protein